MVKEYVKMHLCDLIPYANNPRKNDEAAKYVEESINQVGYITPIIIDENNVVLAGHTRLKAILAKNGGALSDIVEVLQVSGLSDEQKRKFRLLDNKTNEFSDWDFEALNQELDGLDFNGFNFEFYSSNDPDCTDTKYTGETKIPQYEPYAMNVSIGDCIDKLKTKELIEEIKNSNISEEEKDFLYDAATRHIVFKYNVIAEYYAKASYEMQRLMEKSALVIIDVDDAIANGYAKISKSMKEMRKANER